MASTLIAAAVNWKTASLVFWVSTVGLGAAAGAQADRLMLIRSTNARQIVMLDPTNLLFLFNMMSPFRIRKVCISPC